MLTQTITHTETSTYARHVASKVAADLKRLQRIYQINRPSDQEIINYQQEVAMLLDNGYLGTVTYGFKRNGRWLVALKYTSIGGSLVGGNDDPGGIWPDVDVSDTWFTSFLSYSPTWGELTLQQKENFNKSLPFQRVEGIEPDVENGCCWVEGRNYQSGNLGVSRSMIQRN